MTLHKLVSKVLEAFNFHKKGHNSRNIWCTLSKTYSAYLHMVRILCNKYQLHLLNGSYDNASATFYHSRAYIQVVKGNNFVINGSIKKLQKYGFAYF